jgi:hypothetical protein
MSTLEKKWWFIALASLLSVLLTLSLMRSAGVWPAQGMAQWVIYFFCFAGIWKCLSFLGWLIVLLVSPSRKALQ